MLHSHRPRGFFSEIQCKTLSPREGICCESRSDRCLVTRLHPPLGRLYASPNCNRLTFSTDGFNKEYFYNILKTITNVDFEFKQLENNFSSLPFQSSSAQTNICGDCEVLNNFEEAIKSLLSTVPIIKQQLTKCSDNSRKCKIKDSENNKDSVSIIEAKLDSLIYNLEGFNKKIVKYKENPKHFNGALDDSRVRKRSKNLHEIRNSFQKAPINKRSKWLSQGLNCSNKPNEISNFNNNNMHSEDGNERKRQGHDCNRDHRSSFHTTPFQKKHYKINNNNMLIYHDDDNNYANEDKRGNVIERKQSHRRKGSYRNKKKTRNHFIEGSKHHSFNTNQEPNNLKGNHSLTANSPMVNESKLYPKFHITKPQHVKNSKRNSFEETNEKNRNVAGWGVHRSRVNSAPRKRDGSKRRIKKPKGANMNRSDHKISSSDRKKPEKQVYLHTMKSGKNKSKKKKSRNSPVRVYITQSTPILYRSKQNKEQKSRKRREFVSPSIISVRSSRPRKTANRKGPKEISSRRNINNSPSKFSIHSSKRPQNSRVRKKLKQNRSHRREVDSPSIFPVHSSRPRNEKRHKGQAQKSARRRVIESPAMVSIHPSAPRFTAKRRYKKSIPQGSYHEVVNSPPIVSVHSSSERPLKQRKIRYYKVEKKYHPTDEYHETFKRKRVLITPPNKTLECHSVCRCNPCQDIASPKTQQECYCQQLHPQCFGDSNSVEINQDVSYPCFEEPCFEPPNIREYDCSHSTYTKTPSRLFQPGHRDNYYSASFQSKHARSDYNNFNYDHVNTNHLTDYVKMQPKYLLIDAVESSSTTSYSAEDKNYSEERSASKYALIKVQTSSSSSETSSSSSLYQYYAKEDMHNVYNKRAFLRIQSTPSISEASSSSSLDQYYARGHMHNVHKKREFFSVRTSNSTSETSSSSSSYQYFKTEDGREVYYREHAFSRLKSTPSSSSSASLYEDYSTHAYRTSRRKKQASYRRKNINKSDKNITAVKYIYYRRPTEPSVYVKLGKFEKERRERVFEYNEENEEFFPLEEEKDTGTPLENYSRGTNTDTVQTATRNTSMEKMIRFLAAVGTNTEARETREQGVDASIQPKIELPKKAQTRNAVTNTERETTRTVGTDSKPLEIKPKMANTGTDPVRVRFKNKDTNTELQKNKVLVSTGTDAKQVVKVEKSTVATDPLYFLDQRVKSTNTSPVVKSDVGTETLRGPVNVNRATSPVKVNIKENSTSYDKVKTTDRGVSPDKVKTKGKGQQFDVVREKPVVKHALTGTEPPPVYAKLTQTTFPTHEIHRVINQTKTTQTRKPSDQELPEPIVPTKLPSILRAPTAKSIAQSSEALRKDHSSTSDISMHLQFEKINEEDFRRVDCCRSPTSPVCGGKKTMMVCERTISDRINIPGSGEIFENITEDNAQINPQINLNLSIRNGERSFKYQGNNISNKTGDENPGMDLNAKDYPSHAAQNVGSYKQQKRINSGSEANDVQEDSSDAISNVDWKHIAADVKY